MKKLVLRTCKSDMTSHSGFVWPRLGYVSAPDWNPVPECGQGLHGWLWGEGDGSLGNWEPDAVWLVAEIEEYIDLNGKVKFPSANVVFVGDRKAATDYLLANGGAGKAIIGAFITSGDGGTSTSGDDGTSTSGDGGTSTSGADGTSTSGYRGTSTSGDRGTSTSGAYGTSTSGDGGTSTSGNDGRIEILHWDGGRYRKIIGYVGEDGIEANIPYVVRDGKLVKKV